MTLQEAIFSTAFLVALVTVPFYLVKVREFSELLEVVDPEWWADAGKPRAFDFSSTVALIKGLFSSRLRRSFRSYGVESKITTPRNLFVVGQLCNAVMFPMAFFIAWAR
ncbi:hypothetical protein [Microcoleus sp. M2_C2]|uniref:hypothetical protein n=1 Tax=Microcoleus sp. M2_C2 TaxID=3055369 RepID=UPI002FD6A611